MAGAAADQGGMGVAQKRLHQREHRIGADLGGIRGAAGGQAADLLYSHGGQQRQRLIFDHIGQRADDQQLARGGFAQRRDHGGKAGVLTLGEGRLDSRAGIVQHPDMRGVFGRQPFGGLVQIQLDHFGGAGADQKQLADVGAARQQARNLAVNLGLGVDQAGKVFLFKNRGAKAGFGKDHHPGGRLQQMRAGAAAHHQKEGVLHLAVQPDDSRQPAKHLTLATLFQDGGVGAATGWQRRSHARTAASRRAMRSLRMNCAAFTA